MRRIAPLLFAAAVTGCAEKTHVDLGGGGTFAAGEALHVWSGHRPFEAAHVGWSGDVEHLEEPLEWTSTLPMPAADART